MSSEPLRLGGLDLGQRADHSALAVLRRDPGRWAVERIDQVPSGLTFREQLDLILPQLARLAAVAIDTGGTGQAVPELLPELPGVHVVPTVLVAGNSPPRQRSGRLSVGKARSVHDLLGMIRSGQLAVDPAAPRRDVLRAELTRFLYKPGRGFKSMEAVRGHDDTVMALALAVQLARQWQITAISAR